MMVQQAGSRGLIVVTDDDINIRKALGIILRKEGYTVREAGSGRELQQILSERKPDLLFLDIMMPGDNGFDICTELKADPATAGINVFLITARGMSQDVHKGFGAGADEYVLKPFFAKDILALVEKYVCQARAAESHV